MKPTLLLPLVLAAPVVCAAQSNPFDLLPAGTQVVVGIRVHRIVDSELARNLTAELKGQAAQWQTMIAASGFDPLHDLDEVLIASTGAGKEAPTLVIARGTFNVPKLAANAVDYHGVPLVSNNSKDREGVFAFLDGSTALAGDGAAVKAAIDGRGQPAHLDPDLAAKAADYRDRYDIWAIVDRLDQLQGYLPSDSRASALNSIDHLRFGVSVKQGLELAAEVHARTAQDAQQLTATLQFVQAMMNAQPAASPGTRFGMTNENGTIKVSLAISEEDLKKAIEQRQKAAAMFGNRSPLPLPSHTVTAPVEPAPKPAAPRAPVQPQRAAGADTADTGVFTLPGHP